MPRLQFDKEEERYFSSGVSDFAIFIGAPIKDLAGVAFNGLIKFSGSPEGGSATKLYADNIVYGQMRGAENFKGSFDAYYYPEEFEPCMGKLAVGDHPAYFGQQPKTPFSGCYLTKLGTANNEDYSETLHIFWNATADPVQKENNTINENPNAETLSFAFDTVPLKVGEKYKPTAYFEYTKPQDSEVEKLAKYNAVKDYLYGSASAESKLLLPSDILSMLTTSSQQQSAE